MLDLPRVVRNKAVGVGADVWLAGLPDLVAELEAEWGITVGRAYQDGTEALVTEAVLDDGTAAVLKLIVPRPGDAAAREIEVLRRVDGEGCARLFRSDVARSALLLERLGPSLFELGRPVAERHEVLCAAAERLWRPAADAGLPTGAEKGRWLIEQITRWWEDLDRPCSERTVEHALACAERRIAAHDDERSVLVHGDIHQWNALQAADGTFKLVDPDGLLAEPEYDLGIIMREDPVELRTGDPHDRSRWLAARMGCDETAIWEWGVVERLSTALLCIEVDLQPDGDEMLATAEAIARQWVPCPHS